VRSHDFASQRLRPHRGFPKRFELLTLLVELLNHVALVGRRFGKQSLEGEPLVAALFGEPPVRGLLLLELGRQTISFGHRAVELLVQGVDLLLLFLLFRPHVAFALFCEHPLKIRGIRHLAKLDLKAFDVMLMLGLAFAELDLQPIALGCHLLKPRSQILKMCSPLQQKLFELLLGGEGTLQVLAFADSALELLLQGNQLLLAVNGSGRDWRVDVAADGRWRRGECLFDQLDRRLRCLNRCQRP